MFLPLDGEEPLAITRKLNIRNDPFHGELEEPFELACAQIGPVNVQRPVVGPRDHQVPVVGGPLQVRSAAYQRSYSIAGVVAWAP